MKKTSGTDIIRRAEEITNITERVGGKDGRKDGKLILDPVEHGGLAGVIPVQGAAIGLSWGWEVGVNREEGEGREGGTVDGAGGAGGGGEGGETKT